MSTEQTDTDEGEFGDINIRILPTLRSTGIAKIEGRAGENVAILVNSNKKKKKDRIRSAFGPAMEQGLTMSWDSYTSFVRPLKASDKFCQNRIRT